MPSTTRTWTRDELVISTDPSLIPLDALNAAFASEQLYWAKPFADLDALRLMLNSSLCLGMYTKASLDAGKPDLIGFARCVTDWTTMYYLTDVYVLPAYQGKGQGRWLIKCVREVYEANPNMRWTCLVTDNERTMQWYRELLGMEKLQDAWLARVFGPGHVEGL